MNHSWPALATCTVCLLCAAVQIYWGGQDQQGQFHPEYLSANGNLGMSLFFLGPYLCIHRIHHRVLNHLKELSEQDG